MFFKARQALGVMAANMHGRSPSLAAESKKMGFCSIFRT
jgi:hypothetical protein